MILIEVHNRIIEELLTRQIEAYLKKDNLVNIKSNVVDFDGAIFHVSHQENQPFTVSIKLNCFSDLKEHGVENFLRREYGDLLVTPIEDFNVTVSLNFDTQLPKNEKSDAWMPLVRKISMLKRNCFAAVFEKYFEFQEKQVKNSEAIQRAVINYRNDETMYIEAALDRVVVIFSTVFKDADDIAIGRVFMSEFRERRRQFQQAPQVIVSHQAPPAELKAIPNAHEGPNVGYLTFVLSSRHTKAAVRENTIDLIHTLRNYFHYHIKCCKAHMHARMRHKTSEVLKRIALTRQEKSKTVRRPQNDTNASSNVAPSSIE